MAVLPTMRCENISSILVSTSRSAAKVENLRAADES
jgi:hypothetical protein